MRPSPWPLDRSVTFLNHGSYGACPTPVLEAQARWRERMEADPVRFLGRELQGHLDTARLRIAAFLDADPAGLVFVPNATTGVNTVLRSLTFEAGDELLTDDHEYNAILNAVRDVARRDRARVVVAAIPFPLDDAAEVVKAIVDAVTPRTRLAVISHVTSPTGLVFPIAEIVRELVARGIDTLVDGAHAPGMVPLDLTALGAAYWTGNGHKWLCGPKGSAVLHVRDDRRDRIRPLVVSHGANDPRPGSGTRSRFLVEFDWTGTADPTPHLALADGIDLVAGLAPGGWPGIMAANRTLAIDGRDRIARTLAIDPPAPDAMIGSMAALPIHWLTTDREAEALMEALAADRIEVPVGGWPVLAARPNGGPARVLVRISAQLYNEPADYDRLADALAGRVGHARALAASSEGRSLTAE